MSDKVQTAMRGIKAVDAEIVQWENRLEYVKGEVARLTKTRDDLQAEIDQKTSNYNIYVAQRDADSKRLRQETNDAKSDLDKQQEEFKTILQAHKVEKASLEQSKKDVDADKQKVEAQLNNVRQFVIAVQRALTVLGI